MASNTPNFNIPFPDAENTIDEEMRRLQVAWDMADTILKALTDLVETKAPALHGHGIDQISGLATALANKMAANKTFKLSELSDVLGMADAPQGYVPVKNGDGKVFFQSAAAAIGNHQHSTGDIQGLTALIQQYVADALGNDPNFATTVTNALASLNTKVQGAGAPIGTTIMMQGNGNTPPPGYLLHNGAPCTSAYPELRAWLLANGAAVNSNGDPIIEDMGGYFPRGWRNGQVVDSGRVFGSAQLDAFQGHWHKLGKIGNPDYYAGEGQLNTANNFGGVYSENDGTQPRATTIVTDESGNGIPRTATETRPANKTFTYWIKAYAAEQVPGSVDFAALLNTVQAQATRISALETRFVSAPQTILAASTITLAHGLGAVPRNVTAELVCVTAERGRPVGTVIQISTFGSLISGAGHYGADFQKDATNITVRMTTSIWSIFDAATNNGSFQNITPANWRLVVRAFL